MPKTPDTQQKAKNWYADRYESVVVQRNILTLIALLSLIGTAAAGLAVAGLSSSKTVEPYVIEVERKTGIVTTVTRKSVEEYQASEIVLRYFLNLYLKAREGYDATDFQYNYNSVIRLMSNQQVFSQFRAQMQPDNPESPLNLPRGNRRVVKVKSITFLDASKKKVQVRLAVYELNENGQSVANHHQDKIVTMDFNFVNIKLSDEDRMVNPLGFQVQSYRADKDVE